VTDIHQPALLAQISTAHKASLHGITGLTAELAEFGGLYEKMAGCFMTTVSYTMTYETGTVIA